jgi:preprotein translocase subunit SecD
MTLKFRLQLLGVFLLAMIAATVLYKFRIVPGIDLAGGAELRYKVLFEPGFKGDRVEATREAADIVRRRLAGNQLQEPKINAHGEDGIVIQLPGIGADGLRDQKRLIAPLGKLQLFAAASQELQERYDREQVVPSGHKVVDRILIEETPVIEGRHIVQAAPQQEFAEGAPRWVTAFELNTEGAKRFDAAAERLYHQRPRGRIVIMLDGKVRSAPVVSSPAFHGRGQISSPPVQGREPRK